MRSHPLLSPARRRLTACALATPFLFAGACANTPDEQRSPQTEPTTEQEAPESTTTQVPRTSTSLTSSTSVPGATPGNDNSENAPGATFETGSERPAEDGDGAG